MKKASFISILTLLIGAALSSSKNEASELVKTFQGDAIRTHLIDASRLNLNRAPSYAQLTKGKSLTLSYLFIASEKLAMVSTMYLDFRAREYGKKGVALFHEDLVDMKLTPEFKPTFENNEFPIQRVHLEIKRLKQRWLELLENDDLDIFYQELLEILDNGRLSPKNQNCLTRHFVESIARGIFNLDKHRARAKEQGLEDPKNLSLDFIRLQITSLSWAYLLDKRAYSIQQQNIPIFCQDVPAIQYK